MVWLWRNDDEYQEWVHPAQVDRGRPVRLTHRETRFAALAHLNKAVQNLQHAISSLRALGFGTSDWHKVIMRTTSFMPTILMSTGIAMPLRIVSLPK